MPATRTKESGILCSTARFALLLCVALPIAFAQETGEIAFRQAQRELGTDLRLMCVAAHPDDEDDATLALYRKAYGLKTYAIIATRGEGGQNEIGPELGAELGVIRTREMTASAAITGAELHFLDLPEFGFSKSIDETYAIWGKEEALRRMVREIRLCKPDVIITHHGRMKDHGNHQAIGATLIEAFDVAADPTRFPEQIDEGLAPWQASRLYIRAWEKGADSIPVNISLYDPVRGKTYAEIAADALGVHESQGMAFFIERYLTGRPQAYYDLVKSSEQSEAAHGRMPAPDASLLTDLFDRVDRADRSLSLSTASRETLKPRLLRRLAKLAKHKSDDAVAERAWARMNNAAALACDLSITAEPERMVFARGQDMSIMTSLSDLATRDTAGARVTMRPMPWFSGDAEQMQDVKFTDSPDIDTPFKLTLPSTPMYSLPAAEHYKDRYSREPQYIVRAETMVDKTPVSVETPVRIEIAPSVYVAPEAPAYLFVNGRDTETVVHFVVTNHAGGAQERTLVLTASAAVKLESQRVPISLKSLNQQITVPVRVQFHDAPKEGEYHLAAMIDGEERAADVAIRAVNVATPATARVGVVQSYDDTFLQTLRTLRVPSEAITSFSPEYLAQFTTIIVDIRAYLVREDLQHHNEALLKYVENGGHVLTMYHKTFEWQARYAPYPFDVANARVTREEAAMTVLQPAHPFFTTPNAVTARDWDAWVHERGLYFAGKWDSHYTPLLQCADPGEVIPPGSLLIANYGKGTYSYCALALYRQLRDLHPGALRLFANMIAQ